MIDVGRIIYIAVLVAFAVGVVLLSIFGGDEPEKPSPPEIDLSDVPPFLPDRDER